MNINLCILGGNVTRTPEMRYTPKGTAVAEFGIAINRKWKNEAGEAFEEVSFFDCVAFGRTAENIAQWFPKGSAILLEGRLKQEQWDDKETGRKRSKVKVIVEKFHFTAGKAKDGEPAEREQPARNVPPPESAPPADSDDVPF